MWNLIVVGGATIYVHTGKVNEVVKRARAARVHAVIITHLKDQLPSYFGRAAAMQKLLDNLEQEFRSISHKENIPIGVRPRVLNSCCRTPHNHAHSSTNRHSLIQAAPHSVLKSRTR